MSDDKMKLWNAVCETNPAHTKKVTFGRGFTAIDPMHQIRNATEQFGPAGLNWGWEIKDTVFLPTDQVAILVSMSGEGQKCVEQWGQCGMFIDKEKTKTDGDCMKKATTDGITKCLSYLGFNADVFLGKFDDNKYVAEMNEKHKEKPETNGRINPIDKTGNKEIDREAMAEAMNSIQNCIDTESVTEVGRFQYRLLRDMGATEEQLGIISDQVASQTQQIENRMEAAQ